MLARLETTHSPVSELVSGHFREGPGYAVWRSRGTSDWLLIYTARGHGRFGYAGGEIVTQPGDMTLLRPGTPHDYGVEPTLRRWELLWAHFHPRAHWHQWMNWPESAPGLMHLKLHDPAERRRIIRDFREVHRLTSGAAPRRESFAMNALERVLLRCDLYQDRVAAPPRGRIDPRIQQTMDFICRHLSRKLTLEDLSEVSGLSVSRLIHLFREQTGTTPQRFLETQRLHRARQLLELTPRSIKQIAYELGFDNPFYFTQRFKRHTGLSPRAYRQGLVQRSRP